MSEVENSISFQGGNLHLKLNSYILREIGALARCVQSINDIKLKEVKLQKGQMIFVTRICENPGINHIDLSNILKVDKTTTTKAVQKLIEAGYIDKVRDEEDKRMWRLHPRQKALDVYPMLVEVENKNIESCFSDFSEEEKEMVYKLVKRMAENIEDDWKEIKSF